MSNRVRLSDDEIGRFIASHPGWGLAGERLERSYSFGDYGASIGFAMRVALLAERRDHHPDLLISWGKVGVAWSTHDAGGVTPLDLELAELTDRLYAG